MAVVSVLNVSILNNPAPFTSPYQFEITFECLEPLQRDLDWKLTYVGSATSSEHDQELDSLLVGPVPMGTNKFIFEADPPNLTRIPNAELLGVTVILLSCAYDGREFIRIGYYVNNEYESEELNSDPPTKPDLTRMKRIILAEKPRVTRFAIKWDSEASAPAEFPPDQPEADQQEADGENYGVEEAEAEAKAIEADRIMAAEKGLDDMDVDMGDGSGTAAAGSVEDEEEEEESDDGSEDLEAPSSGDEEEDDDDDEEEGEEEADEAMEDTDMGDHPHKQQSVVKAE